MSVSTYLPLLGPLAITWAAALLLDRGAMARRLSDVPNERSLHSRPRSRVGGIAMLLGVLPFMPPLAHGPLAALFALALLLVVVSLVDDVRSLPVGARLAAHFIAAIGVVQLGLPPVSPWIAAVAVLCMVWSANLYNFMDGADGLAGGMAVIGFGALAFGAAGAAPQVALACALLASAAAGFVIVNFPPARVFMGDAGAVPLGFLAAAIGCIGVAQSLWPAWFPVLVFAPFAADATATLVRRAFLREPIWRAHRSHHYQQLVLAGWSHRRLALSSYALMAACAASALLALRQDGQLPYVIIAVWTAIFAAMFIAIRRRTRRMALVERPAQGTEP